MQCLILAAGAGSRLTANGDLKPLFRLAGLPLLERAVVAAQRAGATDIRVVTGYRAPEVEAFLTDLTRRRGIPLRPLRNPHWEDGNGRSVLCAREAFLFAEQLALRERTCGSVDGTNIARRSSRAALKSEHE